MVLVVYSFVSYYITDEFDVYALFDTIQSVTLISFIIVDVQSDLYDTSWTFWQLSCLPLFIFNSIKNNYGLAVVELVKMYVSVHDVLGSIPESSKRNFRIGGVRSTVKTSHNYPFHLPLFLSKNHHLLLSNMFTVKFGKKRM